MNTTLNAMLRLTKNVAETHDNPMPLLKLWKAIMESKDVNLVHQSHKMVGKTLIAAVTNNRELVKSEIEPYDLNESTLLDQIISDLGDTK